MNNMDDFFQNSYREFEKFFGKKFSKVINVGILIIAFIGFGGSFAAYHLGMTESLSLTPVFLMLFFLFAAFLIACIYKAIKYLVMLFRSGKVKKFAFEVSEIIKGILSFVVIVVCFLLIGWAASYIVGSCDRDFAPDHIHFERY